MNVIFLTSCLDIYYKDKLGNKISKNFGNINKILDNFQKYIKKYDNLLFIASNEYDTILNDSYANLVFNSFNLTLPFKNYYILDSRTENQAQKLIEQADFIFLSGGHLPTQNKFFNKINLKELIKHTNAVICGGSAGSMDCATQVYCPPELEGESNNHLFKKELSGLGLTNINILPHYDTFKNIILDNKKYIEEIIIPDSFKKSIYAINDGTYFLVTNTKTFLYGKCYLIEKGIINKINDDNKIKEMNII